jgi:hypothetical protein
MTLSKRRSRTVYKVYDEDEYLAGVDPSPDWAAPPRGEPTHGRHGLRRLAGAAALTGAVGTVGGLVGLAAVNGRSDGHREAAVGRAPSTRPAPSHTSASPARVTRRRSVHPPERRAVAARTRGPLPAKPPRVRRLDTTARADTSAHLRDAGPSRLASVTVAMAAMRSVPPASAAPRTSIEAEGGPRAQSEFGFER